MARQQSRQRRHPRPVPFEHLSARQHNHNSGCSAGSTARDPASVNQIEENARRPSDTEAAFCLDESVWDGRPGGAHAPSRGFSSALAGNIGADGNGFDEGVEPDSRGRLCSPLLEPFSLGNGLRRDAENGNRDIALPSKDPAVRSKAVWGGRTGQRGTKNWHKKRMSSL